MHLENQLLLTADFKFYRLHKYHCIAAVFSVSTGLQNVILRYSLCALEGNRLELSTPNLVQIYSMAVARHALTRRSKVKVTKTVTVAWLLVKCATAAGVGLHVV